MPAGHPLRPAGYTVIVPNGKKGEMAIPEGATALGSNMYLFKSTTNSVDCIISAHGGFVSESRTFTVPGKVSLRFYSNHGASVIDPSISEFFRSQEHAAPVETFAGGDKCPNYLLSKYQGDHNKMGETYDMVNTSITNRDKQRGKNFNALMWASDTNNPNTGLQDLYLEQLTNAPGASVLTIRNRWNVLMGVTLSDAVKAVLKAVPTIGVIHCLFCRSYMLSGKVGHALGVTILPDERVNFG
jgi:Putative adhesin Stv domain